jgi:hypothetical protein
VGKDLQQIWPSRIYIFWRCRVLPACLPDAATKTAPKSTFVVEF